MSFCDITDELPLGRELLTDGERHLRHRAPGLLDQLVWVRRVNAAETRHHLALRAAAFYLISTYLAPGAAMSRSSARITSGPSCPF